MNKTKLLTATLFIEDGIAMDSIIHFIEKDYPFIEIKGTYRNVNEGREMLHKHKPDIVVMETCFKQHLSGDLYQAMWHNQCVLCSVITNDNLFEFKGDFMPTHYIHVPVCNPNFAEIFGRSIDAYFIKNPTGAAEYYHHAKKACPPAMQTINIHIIDEGFKDIMLGDISVLKGYGQQSKMFLLSDDKIHITSKSLGRLEEYLPPDMFLQIAKSYKINGFNILEYYFDKIGYLIMRNYPEPLKLDGTFKECVDIWIEKYRPDLLED